MTEAEALENKQQQRKSSNGDVLPESAREDAFDHTYKEKEGPKPPRIIVWKNVILMTLLHIGALYGVFVVPSASRLTLLWCKCEKKIACYTPFSPFLHVGFVYLFSGNHILSNQQLLCQQHALLFSPVVNANRRLHISVILPASFMEMEDYRSGIKSSEITCHSTYL